MFNSLWSSNVGQTKGNFYVFKPFGSDGTLVDALCENSFFTMVATSPLTELPIKTLNRVLRN